MALTDHVIEWAGEPLKSDKRAFVRTVLKQVRRVGEPKPRAAGPIDHDRGRCALPRTPAFETAQLPANSYVSPAARSPSM